MMKRIAQKCLLVSLGTALFSSLAIAPFQAAQAQTTVTTARYRCEEGGTFRAEYYDDYAVLAYGNDNGAMNEIITLPQVESGSGIRYSDGTTTLYSQGEEAFVEVGDDRIFDDCEAYLIGSSEYTEVTESIVIEERRVEYNRPETPAFQRPAPAVATPAPAPAPAPAPTEPVRGLW